MKRPSAKFSIQNTVDTQLHIYEEIIRRHSRPQRARDGVVICGAYGRGNAGDDAILEAILQEMRTIDPDMPVTVLTRGSQGHPPHLPGADRQADRHPPRGRRPCAMPPLYINGGGSLIQDVTSRRSLWFYLHNISVRPQRWAARCRCTAAASAPSLREQPPAAGCPGAERLRGRHHPPGAGLSEGTAVHGRHQPGDPADGGSRP